MNDIFIYFILGSRLAKAITGMQMGMVDESYTYSYIEHVVPIDYKPGFVL